MPWRGRGAWLLTARRLKSFKCFAIAAVILNVLLFLSLAVRSMPRVSSSAELPASLLDNSIFDTEVQTDFVDRKNDNSEENILVDVSNKNKLRKQAAIQSLTHHALDGGTTQAACSYRTAVYMNNRHIDLNQPPFYDYVKGMVCLEGGDIANFVNKFVKFHNVIVDSSKITSARKGGEKMDDVWNQKEDDEYLKLDPGFFQASCNQKPSWTFSHVDHLREWGDVLECYTQNKTDLSHIQTIRGATLAIQRYEYVNMYHTMTDFYNAFVLMLIFGVPPSKLNILAVDAHPEGTLDKVWMVLFGNFIRAGRLEKPVIFQNLIWGLLGYFSPLNEHDRSSVPYLDEFREFFLSRHNVSTDHSIDCSKLNVIFIWRRDYVAHPRNPKGSVVRKFENEDEMMEEIQSMLGTDALVQGMQLDAMSMTDQLQVVAKADVLIGMHGAGLSHILFLPATSGVIEFKPEYSNPSLQHFKAMAGWRNLPYTIWHNHDTANERASHKTYIPRTVMKSTFTKIHKQICHTHDH